MNVRLCMVYFFTRYSISTFYFLFYFFLFCMKTFLVCESVFLSVVSAAEFAPQL